MPILRVQFPSNWLGWTTPECTLSPILEFQHKTTPHEKIVTLCIDPKSSADYWSDSPVFRGYFQRSTGSGPVALKFAMRDDLIADLIEEARVYAGALQPLQGTTIPRCYGLYSGTINSGQDVACLVLEYWGECLRRPFSQLSVNTRLRILEKLGDIHKHGLLHGDFAERNVLERNGDIRIIDFDQTLRHKCDCDMNFHPGEKVPDPDHFGCDQLWEVCRYHMRLWKS